MMTDEVQALAELTALQAKMAAFRPLAAAEVRALEEDVRIEHVWSSNAIEGSSLTKYETASILNRGMTIHGAPVAEILDAMDLNRAYDYMMDLAARPQLLTATTVRDLNRLAMRRVDNPDAGRYRAVAAWPSGFEETPYTEPFAINAAMADLIDWSHTAQVTLHPVKYAAELHRRFVTNHPFADGNGRTARLLMNLALTEFGYPVINIQPDRASRDAYMAALHLSQTTGDAAPFTAIIVANVRATLQARIATLQLAEANRQAAAGDSRLEADDQGNHQ
ncbi:Fic family protein [Lacticaseibacillus parakribbianus]|uniref:Fic family protein n=1 Tax=Lacticaseibacillus parakribbianus TaxID=2970927 RepID=UPI0021CB9210|nr:Fic family protein [Lacticaseibacillus parakribbianus]